MFIFIFAVFYKNGTGSQKIHEILGIEECEEYFQDLLGPPEDYVGEEEAPWPDKEATISHEREQASQTLQRQVDRMLQASINRYVRIFIFEIVFFFWIRSD